MARKPTTVEDEVRKLTAVVYHRPWDVPEGVLCWFIHHQTLLEVTTEPLSIRENYISRCKPSEEIPVRLRWMHPVWGELPKSVVAAGKELARANEATHRLGTDRAWNRQVKAYDNWRRVVTRCRKSIEKLHAKECPGCPWDGQTLFPSKWGK